MENIELKRLMIKYEYAHGVTSYCPTSMTVEKEKLLEIFHAMKNRQDEKDMAHVVGINM